MQYQSLSVRLKRKRSRYTDIISIHGFALRMILPGMMCYIFRR